MMALRRYFTASASGILSRSVTVACRFLTVPLLLQLLGSERYGLWLLISTFLAWMSMTDLGLISAVQSPLIQAVARKDGGRAEKLLLYVWTRMFRTGMWILFLVLLIMLFTPVDRWFGVSEESRVDFLISLLIASLAGSLGLPVKLYTVVAYANDQGHLPPIAEIAVQVSLVLLLTMFSVLHWGSLWITVVGATALQLAVNTILFRWIVRSVGWENFGTAGSLQKEEHRHLRSTGIYFLLVTIGEGMVLQTDTLLISLIRGPAAIVGFAIPAMFLMQFLLLQNAFLRPLWSIVTTACETNDRARLRDVLVKGLIFSLLAAGVFSISIIIFGDWFLRKCTGSAVTLSPQMAYGFSIYIFAVAHGNLFALYCNAAGLVRKRLVGILAFGITKVAIGWWWLSHRSLETLPAVYGLVAILTDGLVLSWIAWRHLSSISVGGSTAGENACIGTVSNKKGRSL